MNPKAEAVVLVTGQSGIDRDAVFNGFNTPLLPDILVCTQVGQEGIDLHRHCRHVVHYDLGWNPATLNTAPGGRTGWGARHCGSEISLCDSQEGHRRHRQIAFPSPYMDIALPYLAGADERMYDRLRSCAQTFEILTGRDPSAEREGDLNWLDPDDLGKATRNR